MSSEQYDPQTKPDNKIKKEFLIAFILAKGANQKTKRKEGKIAFADYKGGISKRQAWKGGNRFWFIVGKILLFSSTNRPLAN